MEIPCTRLRFPLNLLTILLAWFTPGSTGRLAETDRRALLRLRHLLEYPDALRQWSNGTRFCSLPTTPSLAIACSRHRVTQLTVVGNGNRAPPGSGARSFSGNIWSDKFSIDALFSVVAELSDLQVLSLASLGIRGAMPAELKRLPFLRVLNISSNQVSGDFGAVVSAFENLSSLVLADNQFNGSVPDLSGLDDLEELDLGGNRFGGEIPPLGRNLATVILRNNSLRSNLPDQLWRFHRLLRLDISSNNLTGPIPPSLFSLPSIQYLDLSGNKLTGALPASTTCGGEFKFIDISHNLLVGALPACVVGRGLPNRTVSYSWNCLSGVEYEYQHPSAFCNKAAVAVQPQGKASEGIKPGVALGITGGSFCVVGALGLMILAIFRSKNVESSKSHGLNSRREQFVDPRRTPRAMTMESDLGLPPYQVLTREEIEDATDGFDSSNLTTEGSEGKEYRGSLRDGAPVLVRRLELNQRHSPSQYAEVISRLRHPNLVSVLGHCIVADQGAVFVVLERISSIGSLKDHLADGRKREALRWHQRLAIAMGTARGLQFLHAGGVLGNDLRAESIVLDENLRPKISGYRVPPPGDPEKNDVYQLGRIMVDLITGRVQSDVESGGLLRQIGSGSSEESSAAVRAAADGAMEGTYADQSLRTLAEIASNCVAMDSTKRPSMEDVVWNLHYSVQVQQGWIASGHLAHDIDALEQHQL